MSKSKQTFGFRPTDWEERAIEAAEAATGITRSELIRRCVKAALGNVVDGAIKEHAKAVDSFHTVYTESKRKAS